MNDRFKFRVLDKNKNKYVKSGYIAIDEFGDLREFCDKRYDNVCADIDQCDNYIVEFFTGLSDINGKLIYEGDIVRFNEKHWSPNQKQLVEWNKKTTGWNPFANYDSDCGIYFCENKCEVIGNIHENPELMEKI